MQLLLDFAWFGLLATTPGGRKLKRGCVPGHVPGPGVSSVITSGRPAGGVTSWAGWAPPAPQLPGLEIRLPVCFVGLCEGLQATLQWGYRLVVGIERTN